jgi:3',5'-cyclic AMP phosphodiesterase CpdA
MRRAIAVVVSVLLSLLGLACRPDVKSADFAVLSDVHLHDGAALGASGPDFEAYLALDRKMIGESQELLDAALADLDRAPLDFVLISGDLTKDGERVNHELMARELAALQRRHHGLGIYVVPGNHDIYNPGAVSYLTSPPTPVEQVSPADFRRIYAAFGYREALDRDPGSLSYLAEPRPGIWLLAIDSCDYLDNHALGTSVTSGRLTPATQAWILARLQEAARRHKTVIAMMHHGVVEHFLGESQLFSEYLLTGYPAAGKALADAGLRLVFTGHFHANDVVVASYGTSHLYDVETGSLVTAPSPYRLVHLDVDARTFDVSTRHVLGIPSHPSDFLAWSQAYLLEGLTDLTMYQLTHPPYSLPEAVAGQLAPLVVGGLAAHYAGDEAAPPQVTAAITAMLGSGDPLTVGLGQSLYGLWNDLPPPDGEVSIEAE